MIRTNYTVRSAETCSISKERPWGVDGPAVQRRTGLVAIEQEIQEELDRSYNQDFRELLGATPSHVWG